MPTAQGISLPLKTQIPPSTSLTHLIFLLVTWELSKMTERMAKESRRMPTAQGISLSLKTDFIPFTSCEFDFFF
jgi:hypothetical protein